MNRYIATAAAFVCATGMGTLAAPGQPAAPAARSEHTFRLVNSTSQSEQNEVVTAIRNMAPADLRVFLVPSQSAIAVEGTVAELQIVEHLLRDLDRPHKLYRLTYTLTETDGAKRVGVQHFSMVLASGQRNVMKQGSRVPIVTGSVNASDPKLVNNQLTYLDIGMNFDSEVDDYAGGVRLKSKIEQSSVADEKSGVGPEDPVIRQALLEGTSVLMEGRPIALGSLDVAGSTRHMELEAQIETLH